MTGDQGQDLTFAGIQYRDIFGSHHSGRHDAVVVLALQRSERDDIVLADILQWPEETIAVRGKSHVPRLSRKSRAGYVADRAPEGGSAGPLHHDRRKPQPANFNAADQGAIHGRRRNNCRSWRRASTRHAIYFSLAVKQLGEMALFGSLEHPGVDHNEPAISQYQEGFCNGLQWYCLPEPS